LEQADLPSTSSFDFGIGEYALAILGTLTAYSITQKVGRCSLLLWGTLFMTLTTFLIGFLGIVNTKTHKNLAYAVGSILLIEYYVYFVTIGSVIYTIVAEIPSNYLHAKSVGFARAVYNVNSLVHGQLLPHMIQIASWNWGAKCGFFWGFWMALGLLWAYSACLRRRDALLLRLIYYLKTMLRREISNRRGWI
jgi:SP family general alpha glucoside:H+ symporter-like MFS transporter